MARLLIADDNAALRRTMGRVLEAAGHDVALAENARDALELCRRNPVDVIITDLYMPEMDGIELLLQAQNECPEVPIIAMSGGGEVVNQDLLRDAMILGAVAALPKPFKEDALLNAIDRALADRGRHDA